MKATNFVLLSQYPTSKLLNSPYFGVWVNLNSMYDRYLEVGRLREFYSFISKEKLYYESLGCLFGVLAGKYSYRISLFSREYFKDIFNKVQNSLPFYTEEDMKLVETGSWGLKTDVQTGNIGDSQISTQTQSFDSDLPLFGGNNV